jgi:hypothetical protein
MSDVLDLTGSAHARGVGQSTAAAAEKVRVATVGRVEQARADGLFDADAMAFLSLQRAFHDATDPEGLAELQGIADGFGITEADLFAHLHLGTLRDLKGGAKIVDGCSSWAVSGGPDGPLVVKNRDFGGIHLGIQRVMRHQGPDVLTGAMFCLGSLGSPGAYSSGINAAGLALVDTQVPVATHRVGWLRYFLMTRLLARCATVADALSLIRGAPHAGGGTLVLADAGGAAAAVELGARGPVFEHAPVVWRTNHYVSPQRADDTLRPKGDGIANNSAARFDFLRRRLPAAEWSARSAADLMATHAGDAPDAAPLCQHNDADGAQTISSVVYCCRLRRMDLREGEPCRGTPRSHLLTA